MLRGTRRDGLQKNCAAVFRPHILKMCSVWAKLAKQGQLVIGHACADDYDAEPWDGKSFRGLRCIQLVDIFDRCGAERFYLMSGPEMRREALGKSGRVVYPIDLFKIGGHPQRGKR